MKKEKQETEKTEQVQTSKAMEPLKMNSQIQIQSPRDPIEVVKERVMQIERLFKEIMKPGVDYGVIPGTDKPTLLKPGAEKINAMLQLSPKITTEKEWIDVNGVRHLNVDATVSLYERYGNFVADGTGSCSTLESKYRYRAKNGTPLGPVPKEYWDLKKQKRFADMKKLLPAGAGVAKIDDRWMIVKKEREENPNIADQYNTVKKMAVKRALVASDLQTGASMVFTQDMDEIKENESALKGEVIEGEAIEISEPVPNQGPAKAQTQSQQQTPLPETAPTKKELDDMRERIRKMILDVMEGDNKKAYEALEKFTTFVGRDGNTVPGKKNVVDISDKALPVAYHKIKTEYLLWRKSDFAMANQDLATYDVTPEGHLVLRKKR